LAGALRLGIAIRDAREAVGVTQTESAARMHVAQPAVSRIETGQTNVTIEMLARIATALGAPLSVRIGQEEAPLTR
jgi:UDP-N-acetylglucosamine 1-carboxyvinyltransferase